MHLLINRNIKVLVYTYDYIKICLYHIYLVYDNLYGLEYSSITK